MLMGDRASQAKGGARRSARPRLSHRSGIVLAVAVATYAVGRAGASWPVLALFAAAVAASLFAHLAGRGGDRFAALYVATMGIGAASVAGLLACFA